MANNGAHAIGYLQDGKDFDLIIIGFANAGNVWLCHDEVYTKIATDGCTHNRHDRYPHGGEQLQCLQTGMSE